MCDSLESRDSERQWRTGFVVKGPDERWMGSTTSASRRRCMHVQDGRALRLVYVMTPVASQSHSVHGNIFSSPFYVSCFRADRQSPSHYSLFDRCAAGSGYFGFLYSRKSSKGREFASVLLTRPPNNHNGRT